MDTLKLKCHAEKIAVNLITYARDGSDREESIVLRNLYPETKFSVFGFVGKESGFNIIIRFIALCNAAKRDISMKFGQKEFQNQLRIMEDELTSMDVPINHFQLEVFKDTFGETIVINDKIRVILNLFINSKCIIVS